MQIVTNTMLGLILIFSVGLAQAGSDQDCIVEGTVKSKQDVDQGTQVYVAFHSAEDGAGRDSCKLDKRKKVSFKEPKNAMIENVPEGSKVRYRYTEEADGESEWQLLDVSYY